MTIEWYALIVNTNDTGQDSLRRFLDNGNYIGVDENGAPNLGNNGHGILISGGDDNAIGGTAPGQGNLISGNSGSGVAVTG